MLQLIFDTMDDPQTYKKCIKEVLKSIQVNKVLSQKSIEYLGKRFTTFIKGIAQKYIDAKAIDEFPVPLGSDMLNRPIFDEKNADVKAMV